MEITLTATKEELAKPFPNFAEAFVKALEAKYEEMKTTKSDVKVTVTIEKTK